MNSGLDRSLTGRHHHRDLQVGHDGHVARRLHKTDFQVGITCIRRCEGGRGLYRGFGDGYWRCNSGGGGLVGYIRG